MRQSKFLVALLVVCSLALVFTTSACGGGGQGLRVFSNPLVITSGILPALLSGEPVDFEIPIDGGCGGPYVVEVISGKLPEGVATLDGVDPGPDGILGTADDLFLHKLFGVLLEDGIFEFTIKITDTACDPFSTIVQTYSWDVQEGPVQIVAADPALILENDFDDAAKYQNEWGPNGIDDGGAGDDNTPGFTIDVLKDVVFNQFVSLRLIAAGGKAPYVCAIIDDPADPNDGPLPLGTGMAVNSCAIVGQPIEVLAGGIPFRLSVLVTDSVGNSAMRKFQWKIKTPPLIIANNALVNGQAGQAYADVIQIVDGVPPFRFEVTGDMPGDDGDPDTSANQNDDIIPANTVANPTLIPVVNSTHTGGPIFTFSSAGPASNRLGGPVGSPFVPGYPLPTDAGPNYEPWPSEGIVLREVGAGAGSFLGIPRRHGSFTVYMHAFSTLVPNERGQHVFKPLSYNIVPSIPLAMEPRMTNENSFAPPPGTTPDGLGTIPEAEVTIQYNPDTATHIPNGMEMLATGGVQYDAKADAPHEAQMLATPPPPGEVIGRYNWVADVTDAGAHPPLTGLTMFQPFGIFGTATAAEANNLVRTGRQIISFTVDDQQLPTPANLDFNRVGISVGPDKVIISESNRGFTGSNTAGNGQLDASDPTQEIRKMEIIAGSASITDFAGSDVSVGTAIPLDALLGPGTTSSTDPALGQLLSGTAGGDPNVDLMRPSIVPNGWWNDLHNMNPKGARAMARSDNNRGRPYYTNGWNRSGGGWHFNLAAAELPSAPSVATVANFSNGVRNDGGLMYPFESTNRLGLFIVRKDASIYVPFATFKGVNSIYKFADQFQSYSGGLVAQQRDNLRHVPLSVSPDGRFGVAKLSTYTGTTTDIGTQSSVSFSRLLIFSLCGERVFQGGTETWQIINTSGLAGSYLPSTSIVTTNRHIYFLTTTGSTTYIHWRDHLIHRVEYKTAGGTIAVGVPAPAPGHGANWAQTNGDGVSTAFTGTYMQTPFQRWSSVTTSFTTFGAGFVRVSVTIPNQEMYVYDGFAMGENSVAPIPFRVSADGQHCGLLASITTQDTSSANVMTHHTWCDSNGNGFRQVSTVRRHSPMGASRVSAITRGPNSYRAWGRFTGPSTGFEISDDGRRMAWVYNTIGSVSATSTTSTWNNNRENVILASTSAVGSDPWTGTITETNITEQTFGGTIIWRFGALIFTKDNNGLIFWGGASNKSATSTTASGSGYPNAWSVHFLGTFYSFDPATGVSGTVETIRGIMPGSAGGIGAFPTYTSSAPFNPTTPSWTTNLGMTKPIGAYYAKNREFFYFNNHSPISSSDGNAATMLGINISTLANGSINGHTNGRGFKVGNWPARRSFLPVYYYGPHYALEIAYFIPTHEQGAARQVMNEKTGWVYWFSTYARSGPSRSTSTFASGPPVGAYWQDYGYYGMQVWAFNAEVGGPATRLSHNLGGDTSARAGNYMVVSDDGTQVAYVWNNGGSTMRLERERVGIIRGLDFSPTTGALGTFSNADPDNAFAAQNTDGRAGESIAFDSGGSKVYYAYKASSGNENDKDFVQLQINPAGAKVYSRFGRTGTLGRRSVLYAGR